MPMRQLEEPQYPSAHSETPARRNDTKSEAIQQLRSIHKFGKQLMICSDGASLAEVEASTVGMRKVPSVAAWLQEGKFMTTQVVGPFVRCVLGLAVGRLIAQATVLHACRKSASMHSCCPQPKTPTVDLTPNPDNLGLNASFLDTRKIGRSANQSYVAVGLVVGLGGNVAVILTVIEKDYSWLPGGDLSDVIKMEETRDERSRRRRELRSQSLSQSVGSSAEIGAGIYCDAMEVDLYDASSSGGSLADVAEVAQMSTGSGMGGVTAGSFHKSISMTTLIAMAGDGSMTSRIGSVSKYSRASTDELEKPKRGFGFGFRFRRQDMHPKLQDLSFTSLAQWQEPPMEVDEDVGRLTALKKLLKRYSDSSSTTSSCSSYEGGFSLRRLLCCSTDDWSDDEDF